MCFSTWKLLEPRWSSKAQMENLLSMFIIFVIISFTHSSTVILDTSKWFLKFPYVSGIRQPTGSKSLWTARSFTRSSFPSSTTRSTRTPPTRSHPEESTPMPTSMLLQNSGQTKIALSSKTFSSKIFPSSFKSSFQFFWNFYFCREKPSICVGGIDEQMQRVTKTEKLMVNKWGFFCIFLINSAQVAYL